MKAQRVAVDVGGTFSDCVVEWSDGLRTVSKSPSTSPQSIGVMNAALKQNVAFEDLETFTHGTTVATNALIQRRAGPAALLVTAGYGDVLEVQRGNRGRLYDLAYEKARPPIGRSDVIEVRERLDSSGAVVTPLDVPALLEEVRAFYDRGYRSFGVCLLFSYLNSQHEEAIGRVLAEQFPDVLVSLSSRVAPEWKEFERASTTATNAYLVPVVSAYLGDLRDRLNASGMHSDFFVMQSNGGVMTSAAAAAYPSRLVRSGPAAGARAGAYTALATGYPNALSLDMGGTSTDIALIVGGEVQTRRTIELEVGMPLLGGAVDVESIGSGGGSIARVDQYGRLNVGPESAGSLPGPACYGRGGELPTFVDAAVVLGWLDAEHPLAGGEITIDPAFAERAVGRVARDLGVSTIDAAEGIVRVGLSIISEGAHAASIGRGHDARQMALVAFGGAGPLVGSLIASDLAMRAVVIPPHPGAHSATGLLLSDFRYDFAQTRIYRMSSLRTEDAQQQFDRLEAEAAELLRDEGIDRSTVRQVRSVEARYLGQTHNVEVVVGDERPDPGAIAAAFHARHDELYSYSLPDREIELVTWRVTAQQHRSGDARELPRPAATRTHVGSREVSVRLDGQVHTAHVVRRSDLDPAAAVRGPAIITQMDSSTLVLPGDRVRVDAAGNLVIEKKER